MLREPVEDCFDWALLDVGWDWEEVAGFEDKAALFLAEVAAEPLAVCFLAALLTDDDDEDGGGGEGVAEDGLFFVAVTELGKLLNSELYEAAVAAAAYACR